MIRRTAPLLALGLLLAFPMAADVLVTKGGERIDIRGRWTVDDDHVRFTTADGQPRTLPRTQIDLGKSRSRVTLYSTAWCGYCRKTRRMLTDMGVDFVEKDIEKSRSALAEMRSKVSQSGVPVLDIDGRLVRGFNERLIRRLVKDLPRDDA